MELQNKELERKILGTIIDEKIGENMLELELTDDDFFFADNKTLFAAIKKTILLEKPVELELLKAEGIPSYQVLEAMQLNCFKHSLKPHTEELKKLTFRRKAIRIGQEIIEACNEAGLDKTNDQLLEFMVSSIDNLEEKNLAKNEITGFDFPQIMDDLKESIDNGTQNGLESDFVALNAITKGFKGGQLIVIAGRPKMGKCLDSSTEVLNADTGEVRQIKDIQKGQTVYGADNTLRTEQRLVVDVMNSGIKKCWKITTSLGNEITATANHPFRTALDWTELKDLKVGDKLAATRSIPVFGNYQIDDYKVKTLAYLLGDGSILRRVEFTNQNKRIGEDFKDGVIKFGDTRVVENERNNATAFRVWKKKRDNKKNSLHLWLIDLGVQGKKAPEKYFPDFVFQLPKKQMSLFINRLFSCDGNLWVSKKHKFFGVSYSSSSKKMIRQLQHLLLRFGIVSKVRKKTDRAWELEIRSSEMVKKFVDEIGCYGKENQCKEILERLNERKKTGNFDTIPAEYIKTLADIPNTYSGNTTIRPNRGTSVSRERLHRFSEERNLAEPMMMATSDIYWDKIKGIEYVGERETYDLEVNRSDHSFIANNLVVHNSCFAADFALAAIKNELGCLFFSFELRTDELVCRFMSMLSGIPLTDLEEGYRGPETDVAKKKLLTDLMTVITGRSFTISELRARAKSVKKKMEKKSQKMGLIVVDLLTHVKTDRKESRQLEVAEVSRELKLLAQELDVPIIAVSQLNREVEHRNNQRPKISDLRESGSIEQDADKILLLYRPEYYLSQKPLSDLTKDEELILKEMKGKCEINIAAQRQGTNGIIELEFDGKCVRFLDS